MCSYLIVQACRLKKGKVIFSYLVVDPITTESVELSSHLGGDLTEFRAAELISGRHDPKASSKMKGRDLFLRFNKSEHLVQAFQDVRAEVLDLVRKHHLTDPNSSLESLRSKDSK